MGVQRVLQCHGSFATASCIQCKRQVEGSEIKDAIFAKEVPYCKVCEAGVPPKKPVPKKAKKKNKAKPWDNDDSDGDDVDGIPSRQKGIMKPDITFFGEPLTDRFHSLLHEDRQATDLLLVIGTSLKVAPVSEILTHLPHSVPQILINKTPVTHVNPDVILLGDADEIVKYICKQLDWELAPLPESLAKFSQQQNTKKRELEQGEPRRVGNSHVWLFDGAEGGKWIERMQANAGGQVDDSSKTDTPPVSENSRPTTSRTSSAGLGGESDATRETKKARKK
ncbi:NAD-dependent histone deacetylase sir2 [Tulasnella sp. 418]|nr:NAD-dependent histone deacetylase sir2 [Tulasnella sp. 418]